MILKYMEKIIIIGAGPAGISAALYATRANMDPLVINNGIGALEKAEKIENYYGMEHPVSGKELFETGLAQALMENPDILLLDEPMNGLDKHGVMEMRELFKKLADNGKTIIMANHSSEDIEALCDTVCEMDLGVLERIK